MKLGAILFFFTIFQASAKSGFTQDRITLSLKNVSLETAFKAIEKQSGFIVWCEKYLLRKTGSITVEVVDVPLGQALSICLKNEPLQYTIVGKTILIKEKVADRHTNSPGRLIPLFSGTVVNEKDEPLAGASITIQNTSHGTETNAKGEFQLRNVHEDAVIKISFSGYLTKETSIQSQGLSKYVLFISDSPLDQVQVIAYGALTSRLNTGDITTISSKEIAEQPVNNALLALEGRVPGMFITQTSGISGGAVSVLIQGKNSISYGSYPFYIVDGVPYTSTLLYGVPNNPLGQDNGSGQLIPGPGNPLSFLNPADIESISILKDADATAIYGSRAANGAVIITTKKGKSGKTRVDINVNSGVGRITRSLNLLNTPQYLQMRNEALNNDGLTPSLDNGDFDLLLWDTTRYTDWQKTLIGGTSRYNDIQASVSGGNLNTQFLIGAGFHRETSVFPGSFADLKGSIHFNITNLSYNQRFKIQLIGNYLLDNNQLPATDPTNSAVTLPPDAPSIYNADGTLNWEPGPSGFSSWPGTGNPIAYLNGNYSNKTNNLVTNALISYAIIPGLEIRTSLGYTNMQADETNAFPASSADPAYLPLYGNSLRAAYYGDNNIHSWIVEPQVSYKRILGKGILNTLLGVTSNQIISNNQVLSGVGYTSDLQLQSILAAADVSVQSAINSVYKYGAIFGRINYNLEDKYLINLTIRRDGSSRFGPANQFHNFSAGGVGWIFSKERLIRNLLPILSFGKIRLSYGTTGSDQIGDYRFMDLYTPPYGITSPYQGVTGNQLNNLFNPNLSWEETKKSEVGLEFGFLKDDILINADYYNNNSSNELVGASLPYITGFPFINENLPAVVRNHGIEFVLSTKNVAAKNFSWTTSFNLTVAKNTLKSVSPGMSSYYSQIIGHSLNSIMLYHFLGVNDTTGIYQFASKEGPTSNPSSTDATIIRDLNPSYYGGLMNSVIYKRFQFDFLFQFVKQVGPNYLFGQQPGASGFNQPITVLNRWQKPGDMTNIQKYNSDGTFYQQTNDAETSDGGFTDASYIRLKNISISYEFPVSFLQKAHFQTFRVYALGQDLLTFSHFIGMDPENMSIFSLPPLKVFTLGIQVSL